MNNCQLKYKEEIIWTKSRILILLKLLMIEQINDLKSNISENIIKNLNSSMEWDLDMISSNIDQDLLLTSFNQVKNKLRLNLQYYSTNEFAHKIYSLLSRSFNKKESSKLLTNLSNNNGKDIIYVISKILNLSEGKLMFETVKVISIIELIRNWKSIKIDGVPDYGVNFNMTDLSPSYEEVRIVIKSNNDINIIIPAKDYTNSKISEFSLFTGQCKVIEGHLLISKKKWVMKIPILKFDSKTMELHLFKTNITLNKTIH